MTTENEQPAVDEEAGLDVDLGKVFDEVNKAEDQPEDVTPPKAEEPKVEETPSEPEAEETPPEVEEPQEEPPAEEVAPPATWTADAKEKFSEMDPVLQQEVLKREKDYAQGIEKNASAAKVAESYEQVIAPYQAMIASEGSTGPQAVQSLLNTAYQLRTATPEQKGQLILNLANQYGADLSQLTPKDEIDEYADPEIVGLKNEIASLKQTTQSQLQNAQNQQVQTFQNEIAAFAADPKNEHFEKVREPMSALLKSGGAASLEEAYEKSLYMVPEVRETLIQKQIKDAEAARVKKETDAAAKAKKAQGVQLTNEEAGVVQKKDGTMEEELAAAYDSAQAKAS